MMVGEGKPPLGELAHHGVKGMKWGVRNNHASTADIKDARLRQQARGAAHVQAVNRLNLASAGGNEAQKRAAVAAVQKTQRDFLLNEDRVTAMRMTNGEKAAAAILTGPIGLAIIGANHLQVKSVAKNTDKLRKSA